MLFFAFHSSRPLSLTRRGALEVVKLTQHEFRCKHVFGHNCLKLWLAENDTCPLCRRVLFLRDARRDLGDHADEAHTGPSFTDETDFPSIEVQLLFSTEFIRIIQNDQLLRAHDERHAHDRARAMQNFYVYNLYARLPPPGLLSSLHEGQISTPFQNFVEYFRSQFSEEMLTMTHEYQLFEYLCWKGAFRGRGFDLIREARSFSDLELYCELMHLGVKWENEDESIGAWLTPSGAPFLPLGWHGPLTMALA